MFWTLNPQWLYIAVIGGLTVIIVHTVASRLAPKVEFSWVGYFTSGKTRAVFFLKLRDYLILFLRTLLVFLFLLLPSKPFLYKGKPPKEIWIKDVSLSDVQEVIKRWGEFAEIRFSPSTNTKGKVALIGSWNIYPNTDYEVWSGNQGLDIIDVYLSPKELKLRIRNKSSDRYIPIKVSGKSFSLADKIFLRRDSTVDYSVLGEFEGEVIIEIGDIKFYDYAVKGEAKGEVLGRGLDREILETAMKITNSNITVGVDTFINIPGSILFIRKCGKLKDLKLRFREDLVKFIFSDSGCVFLDGEPILYDKSGKIVGVKYRNLYIFGFSPSYTGWGFTPEFLRFISLFSKDVWKIYAKIGDSVELFNSYEIKGKTSVCCPDVFVPREAGIYKAYKDGELKGIIVVNEREGISIPEPPKPLNNWIKFIIIGILLFEMLLVFYAKL